VKEGGPRRRARLRALVRLVGPALLVVLLWRIDTAALARSLRSADGWLVAAAIALNPVSIHLKVVRWRIILRRRGIEYGLGRAWLAFLTSAYVAMLTPGRVGDVLRIQYLRAEAGVEYAEGFASIVMDRLCDLWVLAGFVTVAMVRYGPFLSPGLAWLSWACVGVTVLGPLVLLVPGVPERLFGAVFRRAAGSRGSVPLFLGSLRAQIGWPLLVNLLLTTATFVVNYLQGWLVSAATGIHLGFVDVLCLLAVASLLGLLPISVSGLGTREAFFALLFPFLGRSAEDGVSFGLLVFGVIYVAITLAGFVAWQLAPPPSVREDGRPLDKA
jgi:hypothetical protein